MNFASLNKTTQAGIIIAIGLAIGIIARIIDPYANWLLCIVKAVPAILLLIYLFIFYSNNNRNVLLSISFIFSSFFAFISIISLDYFKDFFGIVSFILSIFIFCGWIISTIGVFSGFSHKLYKTSFNVLSILIAAFNILLIIQCLISWIQYGYDFYTLVLLIDLLAGLVICFGRYLLINNVEFKKVSVQPTEFSPEQALRILKDKFEVGVISEEEYQKQRKEIIRSI